MHGDYNNQFMVKVNRIVIRLICLGCIMASVGCKNWYEVHGPVSIYSTDAVIEIKEADSDTGVLYALTDELPDLHYGRIHYGYSRERDNFPADIDVVTIRKTAGNAPVYVSQYLYISINGGEPESWYRDDTHTKEEKISLMEQSGEFVIINDTLPHKLKLTINHPEVYKVIF